MSFDVQALGFGRGEALPAASLQPPPLFPPQEFKPVQLTQNEDYEYMLALKQEFVTTLRKSPYYLKLDDKEKDIERYSDKYQLNQQDLSDSLKPDWRRLPEELKPKEKKVRKIKSALKPNIPPRKKARTDVDVKEIEKTLETLEKKEEVGETEEGAAEKEAQGEGEEEEEEEKDEDAEDQEGEELDEDDLEEETDYAFSYFDNGEGYGDDDGDEDEGPVY